MFRTAMARSALTPPTLLVPADEARWRGGVADGSTRSPAGAAGARLSQFPVAGEVR